MILARAVENWPEAITYVGIAFAIAFMFWALVKYA